MADDDRLVVQLVLEAPAATYRPGDVIQGKLTLRHDADDRSRGLVVSVKGESEVSWYEGRGRRRRHFSARERHVDVGVTVSVSAGEHRHASFSLVLPVGIPPSYEDEQGLGHVRYRLDVHAAGDDVTRVTRALVVLGDLDLSLQPELRAPARGGREAALGTGGGVWDCWGAAEAGGKFSLGVEAPGGAGLLPGESKQVCVSADNATSRRISAVTCSLVKRVEFEARVPYRRVRKTEAKMAAVELGPLEPQSNSTWTRVLALPRDLPPSGLPHCSLIHVAYSLKVKAEVRGSRLSTSVELPVVVGSTPRTRTQAPAVEPSAPPQLPSGEAPPPTYEECVHSDEKLLTHKIQ